MKKRLPPLNWLRAFEASARHLNFTQAAAELHMTQAAISQQIKGLESSLGYALFTRLPRGLSLTDAGKSYIPAVKEAIEKLAVATDEIFGQTRGKMLSIRVNPVFYNAWLAPKLADFRHRHPDIGLYFASTIWSGDPDKVSDLEIRYGKGVWPGFQSNRLTWDELFPVCSPAPMNIEMSTIEPPQSPQQLDNYTLLHIMGYEEGWGYWLNQHGYNNIDPSQGIHFDSSITAMETAALGQGIALGRSSLTSELLKSGRLIEPFNQRIPSSEAFYVVRPTDAISQSHIDAFSHWLVEQAETAKESDH